MQVTVIQACESTYEILQRPHMYGPSPSSHRAEVWYRTYAWCLEQLIDITCHNCCCEIYDSCFVYNLSLLSLRLIVNASVRPPQQLGSRAAHGQGCRGRTGGWGKGYRTRRMSLEACPFCYYGSLSADVSCRSQRTMPRIVIMKSVSTHMLFCARFSSFCFWCVIRSCCLSSRSV